METTTPLTPFPQPEETTTEVEEDRQEGNIHPQTTKAATKANQANNKQANKPNGGLNEEAEEEDSQQEEVREEPMGLKPLTHRTPDQNACSAA